MGTPEAFSVFLFITLYGIFSLLFSEPVGESWLDDHFDPSALPEWRAGTLLGMEARLAFYSCQTKRFFT
jgi:hypothetical protein